MKKQYLISLLWISIMSSFLGNSLLVENANQPISIDAETNTGLTILSDSKVKIYDNLGNTTLIENNSLAEIEVYLTYTKAENTEDYFSSFDSNFHVYETEKPYSKLLISPTVKTVFDLGKLTSWNKITKDFTFFLSLNSLDNPNLNIWNYIYQGGKFKITLDATSKNSPIEEEVDIDIVEVSPIGVNFYPSTISTSGEVEMLSETSASIDYQINLGINKDDSGFTLNEILWKKEDNNQTLACSTDLSGTLTTNKLEPRQTYKNTYLIATMKEGNTDSELYSTKIEEIEEFSTKKSNYKNHIVFIGFGSIFLFLILSIIFILSILKIKKYKTVS